MAGSFLIIWLSDQIDRDNANTLHLDTRISNDRL